MSLLEGLKQAALEMELFQLMEKHGDKQVAEACEKVFQARENERKATSEKREAMFRQYHGQDGPSKFSGYFGDAGGPL